MEDTCDAISHLNHFVQYFGNHCHLNQAFLKISYKTFTFSIHDLKEIRMALILTMPAAICTANCAAKQLL